MSGRVTSHLGGTVRNPLLWFARWVLLFNSLGPSLSNCSRRVVLVVSTSFGALVPLCVDPAYVVVGAPPPLPEVRTSVSEAVPVCAVVECWIDPCACQGVDGHVDAGSPLAFCGSSEQQVRRSFSPVLLQSCAPSVLCSFTLVLLHSSAPSILCSLNPLLLQSSAPSILCSFNPLLLDYSAPSILCSFNPLLLQSSAPSILCSFTLLLLHSSALSLLCSLTLLLLQSSAPSLLCSFTPLLLHSSAPSLLCSFTPLLLQSSAP